MPYFDTLGKELKKTVAVFEISTPKFFQLQNFAKKTKMAKFGRKKALFGYFCARTLKSLSHI